MPLISASLPVKTAVPTTTKAMPAKKAAMPTNNIAGLASATANPRVQIVIGDVHAGIEQHEGRREDDHPA